MFNASGLSLLQARPSCFLVLEGSQRAAQSKTAFLGLPGRLCFGLYSAAGGLPCALFPRVPRAVLQWSESVLTCTIWTHPKMELQILPKSNQQVDKFLTSLNSYFN